MDKFIDSYTEEVNQKSIFLDLTGEFQVPGAENVLWKPRGFKTNIELVIAMEYESDDDEFMDIDSFWELFTRDLSYIDRIVNPYFESKGIKFPSVTEFETHRQDLVLYIQILEVEMPNPSVRKTPDNYMGYFGASKQYPKGDKNTLKEFEDFKSKIKQFIDGIKFVEKMFSIPDEYTEIDQISSDMRLYVADDAHISFNWLDFAKNNT